MWYLGVAVLRMWRKRQESTQRVENFVNLLSLTKIAKLPAVNSVASVEGPRMSFRFLGSLLTFGTSGTLSTNLSLDLSGMETSGRDKTNQE